MADDPGADAAPSPPLTRATVWIDGAAVTLLPRRAPVGNSAPIRGRALALFAVPPSVQTTDDPFARFRAALLAALTAAQPDGRHVLLPARVEPGARDALAVLDLAEPAARAVGRALGLEALLAWDGRRARLIDSAAPTRPPDPSAR